MMQRTSEAVSGERAEVSGFEVAGVRTDRGVTGRAIVIGLILSCVVVGVISYSEPLAGSTPMNVSHFPVGFFVGFVALALFVNPLLRRFDARYALTVSEFLTIAAMGLIAGLIPVSGLMGFFMGTLIAPYYFASPENRWAELLHPHIPGWMAPSDLEFLRVFFEGAPEGYRIPWSGWLVPMFWWMCLVGALTFVLLCLAVMFRKQWVENERLVYPLISPVRELISPPGRSGVLPAIAQNRLFWVGFGVGFGVLAWNMVAYFWVGWPRIDYSGRDWFFLRNFPWITTRFNMYAFGFGYFANVDVLFSIWFFFLLYWAQTGIFNRIGYDLGPGTGTAAEWECAGGLLVLVGWGVWVARDHLRAVVRKALGTAPGIDDSRELLSYRVSFFGFVFGTIFALFWLRAAGMAYGAAGLLLLGMYVTYVGLAKVVSESGMLYLAWSVSPQTLVTNVLGPASMSPGSLSTIGFTEGLFFHGKGMFMSGFAQGAKMADLARGLRRRITFGLGLTLVVGIVLCFYLTISWGYRNGAYHFNEFPFRHSRENVFPAIVQMIQSPEEIGSARLMFLGLGVGVMSLLTFLRYRLLWWPIHPLGFAVVVNTRVRKTAFSIFIVWMVKALLLRIGGVSLYRRARPLFIGFLSGYSLGVGTSFLVDVIWFFGQGHWIHIY